MRPDHPLNELADVMFNSPIPPTRQGSASVRLDMSVHSDDSDEFDETEYDDETDEGRLSRSLQTWMIDHSWSNVEPLEKPPAEPLFSGKLGKERRVYRTNNVNVKEKNCKNYRDKKSKSTKLQRIPSDDSIHTNLSLLTCSSLETPVIEIDNSKLKRRKKRKNNSRASSTVPPDDGPFVSKWERFCNMKSNNINRHFKNSSALANQFGFIAGVDNDEESEAFRMLDKDEQDGLIKCAYKRGIRYVDKSKLERSGSLNNVDMSEDRAAVLKRTLSSEADKPWGAPIDIAEIKRERLNRLIAFEQAKALQERERQRKGRRISRISSYKNASSSSSTRPTSPATTYAGTEVSMVQSVGSAHSSDKRILTPSEKQSGLNIEKEENVTVWKADREILEIDLKKELTVRVKQKIESTRAALKRVTGFGDENEQSNPIGTHEEYPKHIEEDFCHKPKIIQRMRISPNLSGIIHEDIRVRMGRPRYHEIRQIDLQQWDKGQVLNRAHRNLKVFNWLHSLKEVTFSSVVTPDIDDDFPDEEDESNLQVLMHVEAADEPDSAPLFRQYEVRIL